MVARGRTSSWRVRTAKKDRVCCQFKSEPSDALERELVQELGVAQVDLKKETSFRIGARSQGLQDRQPVLLWPMPASIAVPARLQIKWLVSVPNGVRKVLVPDQVECAVYQGLISISPDARRSSKDAIGPWFLNELDYPKVP